MRGEGGDKGVANSYNSIIFKRKDLNTNHLLDYLLLSKN